jgi:hypothetical protein
MLFEDALNPTEEELRKWAYTDGAKYPDEMPQDWDLCVAEFSRGLLLLRLASDVDCPKRKFFLSCLYLLVGECVRTSAGSAHVSDCARFLSRVEMPLPEDVAQWLSRSRELLRSPEQFNYNKWCWGGFAYGYEDAEQ